MPDQKLYLPTSALQTALYARIGSVCSCGVYDHVPASATMPYCVVSEIGVQNQRAKHIELVRVPATLHFWSDYEGAKQAQDLADTALQSLTLNPLAVTDWQVVETDFESFTTLVEFDGTINRRHATLVMRWLLQR
jgi:hypothetical protein